MSYWNSRHTRSTPLAVTCDQCGASFETWGRQHRCEDCKRANYKRVQRMRGSIPDSVRKAVYARDGMVCRYCGGAVRPRYGRFDIQPDTAEIEHVVAVVDGGTNDLDNLVVACHGCNRKKQGRDRVARARRDAAREDHALLAFLTVDPHVTSLYGEVCA